MFVSRLFCLYFLIVSTHGQTDPCLVLNHHMLDDPWRSTAVTAGTVYRNDVLLTEGWYRSVSGAGGTIPLTAPKPGTCGTKNPVWMNDTLPNSGETKNAKMCAVGVFSSCYPTWSTVQVKNCGNFSVYYLTRPPGDFGYCFGTEAECPDDQTSETGFTPGCIYTDVVVFDISITSGLEERRGLMVGAKKSDVINLEIKFEHNIKFSDNNINPEMFLYDVNWYINDNQLTDCSHSLIPYANLSTTHLSETCWRDTYRLNFLVKCEIRLRELDERLRGDFRTSDFFEAGFKTDQTSYTVAENSFIDVEITLTVPLGCVYPLSMSIEERYDFAERECATQIAVQTPGTVECSTGGVSNEGISFEDKNCGVRISPNDWNTSKYIRVYGASDNTVNVGSRSSYIRLKFRETVLYHTAWNNALKPDILIVVEDADRIVLKNECYSRNDPHMCTFDGRGWENQRLGEFVLYYNEQRLHWVHAMYQSCPGHRATCNCGVAIRNNRALFVANFCDENIGWTISKTRSNRYIEKSFCDDTHMTINKNGNSYTSILPTGTQISFSYYASNNRMFIPTISIKPSLADWENSSGLCGYLDDNRNNDFRTRNGTMTDNSTDFALDWVVPNNESLFGDVDLSDAALDLPRYCKCRSNSTDNPDFDNNIMCDVTETPLCSVTDTDSFFKTCDEPSRRKRSTSHRRYRRALPERDAPSKFEIVFASDADEEPEPPTWKNGWNETSAEEACRTFIQNQNFLKKCEEVLEATVNDNEEGVQSCIEDIKLVGDTTFMQSTADSLAISCRMTALKLENLTQTATTANDTGGETILETMLKLDCRNNCSGNGICQQGQCVCFGDFDGDECSSRPTQPPIVTSQTNPGLCKRDLYTCNTFFISGSNFADENMTCRAAHFTVTENGYNLSSVNNTFPARSVGGGFGCTCTISDALRRRKRSTDDVRAKRSTDENPTIAEGFFLSVSNDGLTYSADIVVIIYDSWCQKCNTTTVSCFEFRSCQSTTTTTTLPTRSTSSGSVSTTLFTTQDDQHDGYIHTGLVVGAVIGGLGSIVVVLVLTKFVTSRRKSRAYFLH